MMPQSLGPDNPSLHPAQDAAPLKGIGSLGRFLLADGWRNAGISGQPLRLWFSGGRGGAEKIPLALGGLTTKQQLIGEGEPDGLGSGKADGGPQLGIATPPVLKAV